MIASDRAATTPQIRKLADVPSAIPTLVDWFVAEWGPWYGPSGPGDARADLEACCNRDRLPLAVVALGRENLLLGTAAVKHDSLGSELGVGPWLAAMLVEPSHRRRGVGSGLVAAVEQEAARLGYPALFTATDTAIGLLTRRGWQSTGSELPSLRGPVSVLRLSLQTAEASSRQS